MEDGYWTALAGPFRQFVLAVTDSDQREAVWLHWLETVQEQALLAQLFEHGAGREAIQIGTDHRGQKLALGDARGDRLDRHLVPGRHAIDERELGLALVNEALHVVGRNALENAGHQLGAVHL